MPGIIRRIRLEVTVHGTIEMPQAVHPRRRHEANHTHHDNGHSQTQGLCSGTRTYLQRMRLVTGPEYKFEVEVDWKENSSQREEQQCASRIRSRNLM